MVLKIAFLIALVSCIQIRPRSAANTAEIERKATSEDIAFLDECKAFVGFEDPPHVNCTDIPSTVKFELEDFLNKSYHSELLKSLPPSNQWLLDPGFGGLCLNPNSIPKRRGCQDGIQRVGTVSWNNSKAEKVSMVVQCTTNERVKNIIFFNDATKHTCFMRGADNFEESKAIPRQLIEGHAGCAGCHQPYLIINTPLIQTRRLEKLWGLDQPNTQSPQKREQVRAELLSQVAAFLAKTDEKFSYEVGVPTSMLQQKYKVSPKIQVADQGFKLVPKELDLESYPHLKAHCGKCHALGASMPSLILASIFIGHCEKEERNPPEDFGGCFGYNFKAWKLISGKETLHESLTGLKPFSGGSETSVYRELSEAISACRNFHKQPAACAQLNAEAN